MHHTTTKALYLPLVILFSAYIIYDHHMILADRIKFTLFSDL